MRLAEVARSLGAKCRLGRRHGRGSRHDHHLGPHLRLRGEAGPLHCPVAGRIVLTRGHDEHLPTAGRSIPHSHSQPRRGVPREGRRRVTIVASIHDRRRARGGTADDAEAAGSDSHGHLGRHVGRSIELSRLPEAGRRAKAGLSSGDAAGVLVSRR